MKQLRDLVKGIPCEIQGNPSLEIKGVAYHSAQVQSGYLFVAIEGYRVSGATYIDEAINRGAAAVATTDLRRVTKSWVTGVATRTPRRLLAQVANRFYEFPARQLDLVGVTGTNGKTSTVYLLREMARAMGIEPGFLSTIECWDGEKVYPAAQTTPESLDFVQILARLVKAQVGLCLSEVSSHALELDRVFDLDFKAAAFTNLTQDHLDFHGTMKQYRDAKMKLFLSMAPSGWAVINNDDPASTEMIERTRAQVLTYGMRGEADILGSVVEVTADGLGVELVHRGETRRLRLKLVGRHNLYNVMAAYGTGIAMGWPDEALVAGAERLAGVPGRLERVPADSGFSVFVDYAHTPDALRRVLSTVREFTTGRIIAVFGCGGDRDRDKRPKMGAVVAELADVAVVTSDNPRSESPEAIIQDILKGMNSHERTVEPDRRAAIRTALAAARPGDTVVIAGKGHEDYQLIGGKRLDFDDRVVAAELLRETA